MLYSDGIHIISDVSLDDLHNEMKKRNLKRCWFHNTKRFPHYDIPKKRRESFLKINKDIKIVSSREIVKILKKMEFYNN